MLCGASCSAKTNSSQAFQELAKGERTATALENQLSAMEAKINELLEKAEREQQDLQSKKEAQAAGGSDETKSSGS